MTFKDASEKFISYKKANTKPETVRHYREKLNLTNKYIGELDIDDIDKFTIAEFINNQRERNPNISNRTLNYYISTIISTIEEVSGRRISYKKLKNKKKKVPSLSDDTVDIILDHLYEKRNEKLYPHYFKYYFMLKLMLQSGARISEVLNINIKDIDINDRSILLRVTKTDVERYVFFQEDLINDYHKYLNRYSIKKRLSLSRTKRSSNKRLSNKIFGKT